ncbi:hypothetical protein SAE02_08310 [Skermanella aerolata]|uniref:LemA family protein n=2 Tax=Skermanella aerolata TaxID=393310 RepID=A0A512DJM9_9PROT|nr:hypothetical protein N826_29685 [Skermanella aerolata KACC 11604]GEO36683.1 hypothetical protein SAE02_08310 [Skermanella aerolata]
MDAAIVISSIIFMYVVSVYNRMQKHWQSVLEALASADTETRPATGTAAGPEQDLLRRERCYAKIAAYNTYRAQFPQIVLSRLAGFRAVEFPAAGRAAPPQPGAEIIQLEIAGPRKLRDPAADPRRPLAGGRGSGGGSDDAVG